MAESDEAEVGDSERVWIDAVLSILVGTSGCIAV